MGAASFDFEAAWRAVEPDDVATLIYTSGTTGPPKGVQLTHRNLMAEIRAVVDRLPTKPGGRITSFLPVRAHRRPLVRALPVLDGVRLHAHVHRRPARGRAAPARGAADGLGLGAAHLGEDEGALEAQGVTDPAALPEEHRAAIREKLGLDECAWLVVGAAPTPVEVLEYFAALGLPICELWGMSETSSCATINPPRRIKVGTCGPPLKGVELKLADDGELLVRGEIVMNGYRNDPRRRAEAIDDDGWLHTGDMAEIDDDGYVKIVDRKKELIINAAGKNMSPVNIEARLKTCHPLIGTAVAIGDRRPYNVALIVLDPDVCGGVRARSTASRTRSPAALARDERRAGGDRGGDRGGQLAPVARRADQEVRDRSRTEWQPGGDELTPTMKLKRRPIDAEVRRRDRRALRELSRLVLALGRALVRVVRVAAALARARRQRLEPDRARDDLDRGPRCELQPVAAVLGRVEAQHVVVARDRLGAPRLRRP